MRSTLGVLVRCLDDRADSEPTDRDLLRRYAGHGDEDAFARLVRRHGRLVWGVCRRALAGADAEDAFQATFLVLARKAAALDWQPSVGPWLHAVATRLASKARGQRRSEPLPETADRHGDPLDTLTARELLVALDEELAALPTKFAGPVLLCLVEGHTQTDAAAQLGVSLSTLRRRLEAGRERLEQRLRRRGLSLAVLAVPTGTPPAVLPTAALSARVLALAGAASGWRALVAAALLFVALGVGLALATEQPKPDEPKPPAPDVPIAAGHVDRHDDPLPPEALARLGTARLRLGMKPTGLAIAPDGKSLVSATPEYGLRLAEVPSGKELSTLKGVPDTYTRAAYSADGKRLAVIANNLGLLLFEVVDGRLGRERFRVRPKDGPLSFVAVLRDGSVLTAAQNGAFFVHDADGNAVREFGTRGEPHMRVFALTDDGKTVAVGSQKGETTLWDVASGQEVATLPGMLPIHSVAFAPDGKRLATGDDANTIHLWDLATRKVSARLVGVKAPGQSRGVGDAVHSLVFAPDGRTLYSVGDYGDGTTRVWDVATGKQTATMQGRHGDGHLLALTGDGKTLAVAGANGTVRLWDAVGRKEIDGPLGTQGIVTGLAIAPSGEEIALAGNDGMVYVWDRSGKPLRQWRAHERQIGRLAYGADGRLYSCGAYEPARLWDTATGKRLAEFAGSAGPVRGVNYLAVSPDGKRLALATNERKVTLADAATGKIEKAIGEGSIDRLAFSPDGTAIAGGGFDKEVIFWDATGKEHGKIALGTAVAALDFSPDSALLAVGLYSGRVVLLDPANVAVKADLPPVKGTARAVAFSPDGRLLAVSGDAHDVALYEVATRLVVRRYEGHRAPAWALAFTPDGRALVSGSFDGTGLVWDVAGERLALTRKPPLTDPEREAAWGLIGRADAAEGHDAVLLLGRAPDAAAFLVKKLLGTTALDRKVVARLLADLDADDFDARERASKALSDLGRTVEAELRGELADTKSAEARKRLEEILARLGSAPDEAVRTRRAIAALELAKARAALAELARDGGSADLRRLARQAADRLSPRP